MAGAFLRLKVKTLSHSDTDNDQAKVWLSQGNQQFMVGDFIGAVASYDKALEINPNFHKAWDNRGNALGKLGQYEQALASFDKALQIDSDCHDTWFNRGIVLGMLGQSEQAIASYDKASSPQKMRSTSSVWQS